MVLVVGRIVGHEYLHEQGASSSPNSTICPSLTVFAYIPKSYYKCSG